MRKSSLGIASIIAAVLMLTLFEFQNCASPNTISPQDTKAKAAGTLGLLTINPVSQSTNVGLQVQFTASGGTPPYTFAVSGCAGTISAAAGLFTAPATAANCTINLTDTAGNSVMATVLVGTGTTIPLTAKALPNPATVGGTVTITASGGTPPYIYTLNSGGGSIAANIYTASPTPSTASITVTDSAAQTVTLSVQVQLAPCTLIANNYYEPQWQNEALAITYPWQFLAVPVAGPTQCTAYCAAHGSKYCDYAVSNGQGICNGIVNEPVLQVAASNASGCQLY